MPEGWTRDGLVVRERGRERWAVEVEGEVAHAAWAAARREEAALFEALMRLAASWGLAEGLEDAGKSAVGMTEEEEEEDAMALAREGDEAPPAQLVSLPPPVDVVKKAALPASACFVFFRPSAAIELSKPSELLDS
jgi:hypothetical protein